MDLPQLTSFLGYLTIINTAIAGVSFLVLLLLQRPALAIHKKISGLTEQQLWQIYFHFFGQLKILILLFNLGPYLALKWLVG